MKDTRVDGDTLPAEPLTAADINASLDRLTAIWLDRIREAYCEGFHDAEQMLKEAISQVDMNANRGFRYSVSASYEKKINADAVDPSARTRNA